MPDKSANVEIRFRNGIESNRSDSKRYMRHDQGKRIYPLNEHICKNYMSQCVRATRADNPCLTKTFVPVR